jgi:hypothetical protein
LRGASTRAHIIGKISKSIKKEKHTENDKKKSKALKTNCTKSMSKEQFYGSDNDDGWDSDKMNESGSSPFREKMAIFSPLHSHMTRNIN